MAAAEVTKKAGLADMDKTIPLHTTARAQATCARHSMAQKGGDGLDRVRAIDGLARVRAIEDTSINPAGPIRRLS